MHVFIEIADFAFITCFNEILRQKLKFSTNFSNLENPENFFLINPNENR